MWCMYVPSVQLLRPVILPRSQERWWGKTGEDSRKNLENSERTWTLVIIAKFDFIHESGCFRNRKLKIKGVLWFSRERSWPAARNSCPINADSKSATELWCASQVVVGMYHLGCCWVCLFSFSRSGELSEWLLTSLNGLLSLGLLSLEKHLSWIPSKVFKIVFLESLQRGWDSTTHSLCNVWHGLQHFCKDSVARYPTCEIQKRREKSSVMEVLWLWIPQR